MLELKNKINTYTYELLAYDLCHDGMGISVNDVYKTGIEVELSDNMTDKEIIKHLKSEGIIKPRLWTKLFEIDGEFEFSLYLNYKDKPLCELRVKN